MSTEQTTSEGLAPGEANPSSAPGGGFAPVGDAPAADGSFPDDPALLDPEIGGFAPVGDAPAGALDSGSGSFPSIPGDAPSARPDTASGDTASPLQSTNVEPSSTSRTTGASVVLFGGDADAPSRAPWAADEEEAAFIMPIEPARLGATPTDPHVDPATVEPAGGDVPEPPDVIEELLEKNAADVADKFPLTAVAGWRIVRGLAGPVAALRGFLSDGEATHVTVMRPAGSFALLAASELASILTGVELVGPYLTGSSIELGRPEHVAMGIRLPVQLVLVTSTGNPSAEPIQAPLGGITATVNGGALTISIDLDTRVDPEIVADAKQWLNRFAETTNRALEEQSRRLKVITVDSEGAVRLETEKH